MTPDLQGPPIAPPSHILDLVEPWFRREPGRAALIDMAGAITYGELDRLSAKIANSLRGAGSGEAVVIHCRLSRWAVASMLGALRAGLRYIPVDPAFPRQRQAVMFTRSDARMVISEAGVVSPVNGWYELDPAMSSNHASDTSPAVRQGFSSYTCFTSGSTGVPKRVTVPVTALAYSTAARLAYYPEPVEAFLLCSSISFDSSVAGIYWTLASGGCLILPSDRPSDLVAIARAARKHSASHLLSVPSLYHLLLTRARSELTSLRTVIVAGEACPPDVVRQHFKALPGTRLYNEYGPTECTVWATVHACRPDDALGPSVPIGQPIPGTALYLHNDELWIAGPGVVDELPDHTAAQLTQVDGRTAYRTRDLVRRRSDGLLEFLGRADDQLKLGGVRIELDEIEHAMRMHPQVRSATVGVAGRNTPNLALVAFVSPPVEQRVLRAFLLEQLPAAAVPTIVTSIANPPTQPNGKLDRQALDRLAAIKVAERQAHFGGKAEVRPTSASSRR
jgi:amino acid adenylation domain-containing protein